MRKNLIEQPEIDLTGLYVITRRKNGVEEISLFSNIAVYRDPRIELNIYNSAIRCFCLQIKDLVVGKANIIRKTEYVKIAFPFLLGIKYGAYNPLTPSIRYSFYARSSIKSGIRRR